ncbi:NAD(P)H-binding protein [compost metagenome]
MSTVGTAGSRAAQSWFSRWLLPRLIGTGRLAEADAQEASIVASNLKWTIVRPPRLMDGEAKGGVRAGVGLRTDMRSQIRRSDLARFLLDEVVGQRFVGAAPTVVGN